MGSLIGIGIWFSFLTNGPQKGVVPTYDRNLILGIVLMIVHILRHCLRSLIFLLCRRFLLCILVGIIFALIVIGSVALIRVCADHRSRHRREETIREVASKLLDMPHMGQGGQHGQQGGGVGPTHLSAYAEEALQPMLGSSGFASGATTEEGSRATTATHSRNASDGSGIVNGGGSSTVPRVAAEEREWLIHSTRAARHSAPPV